MKKAFSLLELIIIVVIIAIIITLFAPNFTNILKQNNQNILKSDLILIRTSLNEFKTKQILLQKSDSLNSLDDANINIKNQKLFTNVLEKIVLSTSKDEKREGFWLKDSSNIYWFVLSSDEIIKFKYENNLFSCISEKSLCLKVE